MHQCNFPLNIHRSLSLRKTTVLMKWHSMPKKTQGIE